MTVKPTGGNGRSLVSVNIWTKTNPSVHRSSYTVKLVTDTQERSWTNSLWVPIAICRASFVLHTDCLHACSHAWPPSNLILHWYAQKQNALCLYVHIWSASLSCLLKLNIQTTWSVTLTWLTASEFFIWPCSVNGGNNLSKESVWQESVTWAACLFKFEWIIAVSKKQQTKLLLWQLAACLLSIKDNGSILLIFTALMGLFFSSFSPCVNI